MVQPRDDLDFALESLVGQGRTDLRAEKLERQFAVMPRVPCLEYHGHTAATQFRLDRVTLSDLARELAPLRGERQRAASSKRCNRREVKQPS